MIISSYEFGKNLLIWEDGQAKNITFIVTEDCQLSCRYCYLTGKNKGGRMDFEIARRTVDYLLKEKDLFNEKSVIWDFIGGEPFLEIGLIDKISDYIKIRTYEDNHPWFNSYRFKFSTNGLLYGDKKVQKYIEKNRSHIDISISIDGTKKKHDMQRIFPDGKGSYDDVVKNIPQWIGQFPDATTKVTVAHDDLAYIYESVLHIWELGIRNVNINVVFENVWSDGDDKVLEEQLVKIADYVIDNKLFQRVNASFFSDFIGKPLDQKGDNRNWCGAGRMLAVDYKGDFYPCVRFAPFSMNKRTPRKVGNCFEGLDFNKLRPFLALDRLSQSSKECLECDVASGCAWCQALNYDEADTDTIYQRATFICKMHKARVRANQYYRNKVNNLKREKG